MPIPIWELYDVLIFKAFCKLSSLCCCFLSLYFYGLFKHLLLFLMSFSSAIRDWFHILLLKYYNVHWASLTCWKVHMLHVGYNFTHLLISLYSLWCNLPVILPQCWRICQPFDLPLLPIEISHYCYVGLVIFSQKRWTLKIHLCRYFWFLVDAE